MYEPLTPMTPPGASNPTPTAADPVVWTPSSFQAPAAPVAAGSMAPATGTPGSATIARPERRSVGPRFVATAVLASALLASGGTFLAVNSAGVDRAAAQAPTTGGSSAPVAVGGGGSVVELVKAVSPAVVTIVVDGITSTDPMTGLSGTGSASGSGVIFDSNGLILTNHHVVAGDPSRLTVNLQDGRSFDATIYGIDTLTDLAIVKVDATGLPTAPIGESATIQVGQEAIAIGSPLGTFTGSVTSGIISAIGRSVPVETSVLTNLIQTDTAINPGNSGGPLFDANGTVIGINTAGSSDAQGIGFAIPIDLARPLMTQASAGEPLARPWLGIRYETIDRSIQETNSLPVGDGAWIPSASALAGQDPAGSSAGVQDPIVADSPAARAGLQPGDIIIAVDGTKLDATHPLDLVTSGFTPGTTVTLDVLRDGQAIKASVILGTRPATF